MALKRYQPHRTDLLINTDWGIEKPAVSKEEAAERGMVLFHGRWVTKEEKRKLKDEQKAYSSIRSVAWLLWIGAALIFTQVIVVALSPNLEIENSAFLAYSLTVAILAVPAGIGIHGFTRWGRIVGNIVLILGIPTVVGLLCLYYLNRKQAREILVSPAAGQGTAEVVTHNLRDALGLGQTNVIWPLFLAYLVGLLLADLIPLGLAPSVHHGGGGGWSVSFFEWPSKDLLPLVAYQTLGASVIGFVAVFLGLRWVRHGVVGVLLASVCYACIYAPPHYLVVRHVFPDNQTLAWSDFLGPVPLLFSAFYFAVFLGSFGVAVRYLKSLLLALLAGSLGGTVVWQLIGTFRELVLSNNGAGSAGDDMVVLRLVVWGVHALVHALLLALLWYAAIRLFVPGLRLARAGEGE